MSVLIPCREKITVEKTMGLYLKHMFMHFGLPAHVISNQDPYFTSNFTWELCKQLGIMQNISTAYHPHTNGQLEATNKWVE
jgi:hypothetical protein